MGGMCRACGQPVAVSDAFCGSCGEPAAHAASGGPAARAVAASDGELTTVQEPGPEWPDRVTVTDGNPWLARATGAIPMDAALGQRTPNATYIGQRLLYDKVPEPSFDPLSNRSLLVQFFLHFLVYFAAYWVLAVFFGIVLTILGLVVGLTVGWLLWVIGAGITGLLFACLYWLIPVPALLSEWKFAIDAEGAVAPVTFEHIGWAIRRHETPLDSLQIRRLKFTGSESRDYLELRRGLFTGFVSCFAHGRDLYIGWTLWVRLSPARWLLMAMARIWQTLMRRGTELHVTLRYESARALREAIHSVAREGVDVAIGQLHAQGAGSIAQMPVAVSEVDA
jgi:hypothetical protein